MAREMTWREFLEWRAYFNLEPFGEERADLRAAQIVTAIYNTNIDPKKTKPFKIEDVVLRFGDDQEARKSKKKQTWQMQKELIKGFYKTTSKDAEEVHT